MGQAHIRALADGVDEHKGPEFTKLNPNGRIPVLIDHANNDFTLWYV